MRVCGVSTREVVVSAQCRTGQYRQRTRRRRAWARYLRRTARAVRHAGLAVFVLLVVLVHVAGAIVIVGLLGWAMFVLWP